MSSFRIPRRPIAALLALGGFLLCAGPASAAGSRIVLPVTDAPAPPQAAPAPVAPQGSRAIPIPPGANNPMRETAPGVYEGIVPVRLPDGSWLVELDERFHAFAVAKSPGKGFGLAGGCVHSAEGLARWRAAQLRVRPTITSPAGTTLTKWEDR